MTGPGPILDLGVPVVVRLLMFVVGLELTWADFARVLAFPRTVLLATAGQLVLLPLLAAVMIWTLTPPPMVVAGLVLLAATSGTMILHAVLYAGGAMAAGWGLGRVLRLSSAERFTLLLELSARNLAVTALVGVTVLDRPDFVLFPALFLLIQLPLIALAIAVRKYRRGVFLSGSPVDICR